MRTTLLIIGLGLTVLGAGCAAKTTVTVGNTNATVSTNISVNTSTTGTFSTSTSSASTVTITSSGVSPKTITVSKGTTVSFKNDDSINHQIASNPHPSHTDLPGFDSLSGIQAGDTYTFTFNQTGSFGYHDHADPFNTALQGTVIVQ